MDPSGAVLWEFNNCELTMVVEVYFSFDDVASDGTKRQFKGDLWSEAQKELFKTGFQNSLASRFGESKFVLKREGDTTCCQHECTEVSLGIRVKDVSDNNLLSLTRRDLDVSVLRNPVLADEKENKLQPQLPFIGYTRGAGSETPSLHLSSKGGGRTLAHEFGHFLELEHPSKGLRHFPPGPRAWKGVLIDPNDMQEYETPQQGPDLPGNRPHWQTGGLDIHGREVSGDDLMGGGIGMRPFYFNKWRDKMNDNTGCGWTVE